jgi:hypothetical protein
MMKVDGPDFKDRGQNVDKKFNDICVSIDKDLVGLVFCWCLVCPDISELQKSVERIYATRKSSLTTGTLIRTSFLKIGVFDRSKERVIPVLTPQRAKGNLQALRTYVNGTEGQPSRKNRLLEEIYRGCGA